MNIKRLLVQNFRNINFLEFYPSPKFNLIYGPNGSGKTSLIEAITYLALGRSFRNIRYTHLINNKSNLFSLYSEVERDGSTKTDTIGLSRSKGKSAPLAININQEKKSRLIDIADRICVQIIHPQGTDLITGTPEIRRSFIDWGTYYQFSEFKSTWIRYKRLLSQRNALLKQSADKSMIVIWDQVFAELSEKIAVLRQEYISALLPILEEKIHKFLPDFNFKFYISKGWDDGSDLLKLLTLNLEKDRVLGYTFYGCHRADLKIKYNQIPASEVLSRGQLKLLVCAMRLSQGALLKKQTGKDCIFLIDDISSELDSHSQELLFEDLSNSTSQVFITNISKNFLNSQKDNCKLLDISASLSNFIHNEGRNA
ncbi:MAG TPA: DNA replication/repair protein RecF [Succinivibrionaceae bacterium]|nr:DNA replication/repair protein RecF [Succinivibrionaceae bacterium]